MTKNNTIEDLPESTGTRVLSEPLMIESIWQMIWRNKNLLTFIFKFHCIFLIKG